MKKDQNRKKLFCLVAIGLLLITGCDEKKDKSSRDKFEKSQTKIASGTTIGQLCQIFSPATIPVNGYALVGGLRGTGSSDCPPQIREYLRQYMLRYIPDKDVNKFINSKDTSVVLVEGLMPTAPLRGERFDVHVVAPASTQTTSIEGGRLYGVELRAAGTFGLTAKILAKAEGPVYVDTIEGTDDKRSGYVLNGGVVIDEYFIMLSLLEPDYLVANMIRNKLIERFGEAIAKALSPGQIEVKVPQQYIDRKQDFISIIDATYLSLSDQDKIRVIEELISQLSKGTNAEKVETALEAIGKESIKPLKGLLQSSNELVRLSAARCLLNIGNDSGFSILRKFALDINSDLRMEAFDAIIKSARQGDISALSRRLLGDTDIQMRLAAYEQLRRVDDIAVTSEVIAGDFVLEQIAVSKEKMIFASRSGTPRIALFAGPLYCSKNLFVQSSDGNIIVNGLPEQNFVNVIRQIPGKAEIGPISLKCSFELRDIIRTLGSEPIKKSEGTQVGLGVSYYKIVELLKKMSDAGAVEAEFYAGDMPQISLK